MNQAWISTSLWKTFVVVLGAFFAFVNVRAIANWRPALDPATAGSLGMIVSEPDQRHHQRIERLDSDSPLTQLGAHVGDAEATATRVLVQTWGSYPRTA